MLLGTRMAAVDDRSSTRNLTPMPRKQRFKPSRKPKPSPQTEEAMIGHPVSNPSSDGVRAPAPDRDDESREDSSPAESEFDQRSR